MVKNASIHAKKVDFPKDQDDCDNIQTLFLLCLWNPNSFTKIINKQEMFQTFSPNNSLHFYKILCKSENIKNLPQNHALHQQAAFPGL